MWWWDGAKWVPATQAPVPPPPMVPPSYYAVPPAATYGWQPSPGLRPLLIVCLAIEVLVTALFSLAGVAGETQSPDAFGIGLLAAFIVLFALAATALVAVLMRLPWARWVALASGIALSLTCLGAVIGIPIIVTAARAPLGRARAS